MIPARHFDAGRELLDHQLVDRDGLLCGNVDDLELDFPDDGGPPRVVAVLNGPGVLASRIGGTVARGLGELHRRLHPTLDGPARIPMADVADIGSAVRLSVSRSDLDGGAFERWIRDHVIARIPGDRHAAPSE